MPNEQLTFVVGTGRCGSTALSAVVNLHPGILSLNELFASVVDPVVLTEEPLSGPEFWGCLARPNPVSDSLVRNGAPPPEFLYNRHPEWRHSAATTGIPAISMMVLPHLTDDPDGLLDDLEREIRAWPTRPAPLHWQAFFATLAERFGTTGAVVERSGLSLGRVGQLHALFPQARFVHLHRDGPDCALSMSRHIAFRMLPMLAEITEHCGVDSPHELTPEHFARLPADLAPLLTGSYDPALIMDRPIPLPVFGAMWSRWIVDGVRNLEELPAGTHTALSYEQLLDRPREELTRLAGFIGVEARPDWLDAAVRLLDGAGRRGSALRLDPVDLEALRESCAEGAAALEGTARRQW
ncbi:sulfotransferase [Actinacidiphila glaucinigra]|uniref:Sulfotransferase family protein n=1 Tax=Actinacidiphila glaucinigra TaxID=235986 RepID=A0A239IW92_9ACTN|nr:sulfotransferase [Actinacidiphila glaucinigra]SNS97829.1 Sulfotransferase family protein [Actinacidiphila glaucinigra]